MNPEDFLAPYESEDEWDDEEEEAEAPTVSASYACEDCDYRWDGIEEERSTLDDFNELENDTICPMCGSTNVTQI